MSEVQRPIRFVMVGGFLGAGKTTALARLAARYQEQGKRVGLVTNDQAFDLVDTHQLRQTGLTVGEVPGACFCCKFGDLVATMESLRASERPDVILAEPVGSCTDLVATVVEPLKQLHGNDYTISPLAVLLKPEHGLKILRQATQGRDEASEVGETTAASGAGFSPEAAYIFLKQIEEADLVVVNKIDKLTPDQRQELAHLIDAHFPGKPVLMMSARTGENVESFVDALDAESPRHRRLMEVDYDVYATGEAELGWLNCIVSWSGAAISLGPVALATVERLRVGLLEVGVEPAHLKVFFEPLHRGTDEPRTDTSTMAAVANLVASDQPAELSQPSDATVSSAEMIVNARAAADPEVLESVVRLGIADVAARYGSHARIDGMQRFRPGRPVPTHRVTAVP